MITARARQINPPPQTRSCRSSPVLRAKAATQDLQKHPTLPTCLLVDNPRTMVVASNICNRPKRTKCSSTTSYPHKGNPQHRHPTHSTPPYLYQTPSTAQNHALTTSTQYLAKVPEKSPAHLTNQTYCGNRGQTDAPFARQALGGGGARIGICIDSISWTAASYPNACALAKTRATTASVVWPRR